MLDVALSRGSQSLCPPTLVTTSSTALQARLYTLYAPPNHRDGVVHATKAEAEADKEHFDGKTTE